MLRLSLAGDLLISKWILACSYIANAIPGVFGILLYQVGDTCVCTVVLQFLGAT